MTRNQIRQSQLVLSFGPGSMIDLPNRSVLILGLDSWYYDHEEQQRSLITEPRLTTRLAQRLQVPELTLRRPPRATDSRGEVSSFVRVMEFPKWFTVTHDVRTSNGYYRRRLVQKMELENHRMRIDGETHGVVPVRFVGACIHGHLTDINWKWLIHGGPTDCTAPRWIEERGNTGDLTEVFATCECGGRVRMSDVATLELKRLGTCYGKRPWLGLETDDTCKEQLRLLIRNATNAYFPERITVISLPSASLAMDVQVSAVRESLSAYETAREGLPYARKLDPLKTALLGLSDQQIWETYDRLKSGTQAPGKNVKEEEYQAITAAQRETSYDDPGGDFFARELKPRTTAKRWMAPILRVVLLHRLRAVTALVGFTRFEPSSVDISGELDAGVKASALARSPSWLPATESRGEGVFVELHPDRVAEWLKSPGVVRRTEQLVKAFDIWKQSHPESRRQYPGTAFYMLHTLSHLLMSSIAIECGYPASGIQERIYLIGDPVTGSARYGLLMYTAATDAEGTLGGLVETGRKLERHLRQALESAILCSNDPVCAQHDPTSSATEQLNGAACHGCVIAPETSCEQRNEFLDRALVVPTIEIADAAFFGAHMP